MHYTSKVCHALHVKGLPYITDQQVALWYRQCIERCLGVLRDLPVVGGAGVAVVGSGVVVVGSGVVVVGSGVVVVGSGVVVVGSSDVVVTGKGVVVGDGDSTVVVVSSQESSSVGPCEELLSSSFSASKALAALRGVRW